MREQPIREFLELDLHPTWVRLYRREITAIERGFDPQAPTDDWGLVEASASALVNQKLIVFLQRHIAQAVKRRHELNLRFTTFRQSYAHAASEDERREHVLALAGALGASRRQLAADRRAFKRWFGYDAIGERYRRREASLDRTIAFALGRLGALSAHLLEQTEALVDAGRLWRRMALEHLIKPLLNFAGDTSVRVASFRCLAAAAKALPAGLRELSLSDSSHRYVYRTALETTQDIWLQCEALTLLRTLSLDSLEKVIRSRLGKPGKDDDLFVRCHAVRLLGEALAGRPQLASVAELAVRDESPAVRHALAGILGALPDDMLRRFLPLLTQADDESAVRGAAVLALRSLCASARRVDMSLAILVQVLGQETDPFVLRVALATATQIHADLESRPEAAATWTRGVSAAITRLHTGAEKFSVRRWAAQARERMWFQSNPEASALVGQVAPLLRSIAEGRTRAVPRKILRGIADDSLGRCLALLAQNDFGFDVERRRFRPRIARGHSFGFRLWRFLYEYYNPGTDKRQGVRHTVGRVFRGTLRVPSAILSELAQTKVPGEPLFLPTEDGWRPYLPLVDDVISALDQPRRAGALKIYTSEGITEVCPPPSLWHRVRARFQLTRRFHQYAELRNWREDGPQPCRAYVAALRDLGFSIRFRGYAASPDESVRLDPAVVRFFPAAFPLSGIDTLASLKDYFFSVYENNLQQLTVFLLVAIASFLGRHIWISRRIRSMRRQIPLVIGGWGTRGKSGTERIKAALFNALGHSLVSKTSGCEAMFLHGHTNGALREMFLFRPYDKATIWEQVNVVRIAGRLGVEVFLWECMGLTPAYVAILQQQWMRDDLSTITNTYPDHEDLQGPAGINIPEVMTNFIPADATLITTEEQMLPKLKEGAKAKRTLVRSAGWLEAGLLTSDVLDRFPYAEHPYNIALVLELADELGIERDFALKEMADRVVPDLGVLKALPNAPVRCRGMEFVNGMSANERFGCLGNWERMGFANQDPYTTPGVWLTTVVNNRADRVPRSKVFASILVQDIAADRHFLIGTNLDGLLNYIREAWQVHVQDLSLDLADRTEALGVLIRGARSLRIPYEERHLEVRLKAMLAGLGLEADSGQLARHWSDVAGLRESLADRLDSAVVEELVVHAERMVTEFREFSALAEKIRSDTPLAQLNAEFRSQLWNWFHAKLILIEDPHASGHQIIEQLVTHSPPGLQARVMGLQNIKGTGLDFVYRWQAWEACYKACEELLSQDPSVAERGLRALAAFQDYNILCEEHVRSVVEEVKHRLLAQNESFQAELKVILSTLDNAMQAIQAHLTLAGGSSSGLLPKVLAQVEAFLDAGDAIRRRKAANRIYRDLAAERISHERAALELQALNKRQKGGWLQQKVEALLRIGH